MVERGPKDRLRRIHCHVLATTQRHSFAGRHFALYLFDILLSHAHRCHAGRALVGHEEREQQHAQEA